MTAAICNRYDKKVQTNIKNGERKKEQKARKIWKKKGKPYSSLKASRDFDFTTGESIRNSGGKELSEKAFSCRCWQQNCRQFVLQTNIQKQN